MQSLRSLPRRQFPWTARLRRQHIALTVALLCSGSSALYAQILPTGGVVAAGTASIGKPASGTLSISQSSPRAVINWADFSIGSGGSVNVKQPGANAMLLNRVTGGVPSALDGALNANGKVFLVNPNGILVGGGASINAGGFIASTIDVKNGDVSRFMSGQAVDLVKSSGGPGHGITVDASSSGAPQIKTVGGEIILLSDSGVLSHGALSAAGGSVQLLAAQEASVALGNSGFVQVALGGAARSGSAGVTGSINVASATGQGGSVRIDAPVIELGQAATPGQTLAATEINANGATGGGSIIVGGDKTTLLRTHENSTLKANATDAGSGGHIELLAMGGTSGTGQTNVRPGIGSYGGAIEATGRGVGHQGGQIETSAQALNVATTKISAAGQQGAKAGTWTLDPFDITISSAETANVVDFHPAAPGAVIKDASIGAVLNGGTSVSIATGNAGTDEGNITLDGANIEYSGAAENTFALQAANNIVMKGSKIAATGSGKLNVILNADRDGNGDGSVSIQTGGAVAPISSMIGTKGGNLVIGGGSDPLNNPASKNSGTSGHDGVYISNASIDAGTGAIIIHGHNKQIFAAGNANGIYIENSSIQGGSIGLRGASDFASGIYIVNSTLHHHHGQTKIHGNSSYHNGVTIRDVTTIFADNGNLDIAGLGGGVGVQLAGVNTETLPDASGLIRITGKSNGDSGSSGVSIKDLKIQGRDHTGAPVATGASILFGGKMKYASAPVPVRPIALESATSININSTGYLGLRPAGVELVNGNLEIIEDVAKHMTIGGLQVGNDFGLDTAWFGNTVTVGKGTVVGSTKHMGNITVAAPLTSNSTLNLSLQNQGTNAGDSIIHAPVGGKQLTIATAGHVSQQGAEPYILSEKLVLAGTECTTCKDASFDNKGNSFKKISFDPFRNLKAVSNKDLSIESASFPSFDGAAGKFVDAGFTTNVAGKYTLIQSTTGSVTLKQDIQQDASGVLDIVAQTLFQNPDNKVINNGQWRIWSNTWTGSNRGGLVGSGSAANLYGCVWGDSGKCSISGAPIPETADNRFLYQQRPIISISADQVTGATSSPIPALSYSVSGLINGDAPGQIVQGEPATAATSSSPAGSYQIDQGSLEAHNGYVLGKFTPGKLTLWPNTSPPVTPPPVVPKPVTPPPVIQKHERDAMLALGVASAVENKSSDVYGKNLDRPNVCVGSAGGASVHKELARKSSEEDQVKPITLEWPRVKGKPQLSSCLDQRQENPCAAF